MSPEFWTTQSPVTEPGAAAKAAIDELPSDLASLRRTANQLVFHYRAGDFKKNNVPTDRKPEINLRYAEAQFGIILGRGPPSLVRERQPIDQVVGCCRDSTTVFLALARHKGYAARARVGFAAYIRPGWFLDHVVAEVWDEAAQRWRLVDADMPPDFRPLAEDGKPIDWDDVPETQFLTGPRAWRSARAGTSDPERYVVDPGMDIPAIRGWPYLAHNLIHDLAALNKTEMILWDVWEMQMRHEGGPIPEADAEVLDRVSAATVDAGVTVDVLAELFAQEGLKVPKLVTSFDPLGGPPVEVDVSRTLGI
ncbi:hypothetical protein GQ53DRAFT_363464 [Thozetella sp. PMI_491]|nr:hypothetical protein GQ53DRAFT_363464 [Thozetella sp. PMI_491]